MYESHNLAIMIKRKAKEKNITIKDMLSDLSLGSNTMSGLYHGKSIAYDSLAKIADYLECSVDTLLERTAHNGYTIDDKYEKMVIDQFRTLSDQGKEYILQTLAMAVNQYKKDIALEYNERKVN